MELNKGRTGKIAALLFFTGPLLASIGLVRPLIGFALFAGGGLSGIIALVSGGVGYARGREGATTNIAIGALLTVVFLWIALPGRGHPRINDITTDTANPPKFVSASALPENQGRDLSYPGESFSTQQKQGYPKLSGLPLAGSPDEVFGRVQATAATVPNWQITNSDPAGHHLEGVATSRLFRFKDDFVIEVRESPNGSRVEMRSKSRDGRGDIGANAARIESFLNRLRDGRG